MGAAGRGGAVVRAIKGIHSLIGLLVCTAQMSGATVAVAADNNTHVVNGGRPGGTNNSSRSRSSHAAAAGYSCCCRWRRRRRQGVIPASNRLLPAAAALRTAAALLLLLPMLNVDVCNATRRLSRMSSPGIPWTKGEGLAGSSSSSDNGSSSSSDHGSSSSSDHGSSSSSDNGSSSGGSGTCGDRGHGRGNNVGAENVGDGYGCSSRYSGCNNFSRTTEKCTTGCAPTVPRVARTYFVAADKVIWKYAPSGRDRCTEPRSTAVQQLLPPRGMTTRLGGSFVKAQYRQYTDSSFQALLPRPPEWDHLGILGPPLYGAVGEVVRVVFRNHLPYAVNMVPTGGLLVDLENPSISCTPSSSSPPSSPSVGDARLRSSYKETEAADRGRTRRAFAPIPSNGTVSYLWTITAAAGPWVAATAAVRNAAVGLMGRATVAAAADVATATVTSRLWLYRSTVDPEAHDNAGLVGPMLVAADWAAGASGRAVDVDRDVVTLFTVMDERASPYASENAAALRQFQSAHYSVNGYIWCNGPRTNMQLDRDQEEQPTNTSSSHLRSSGGAGASDGDGGSGRSSGSDGGGGRSRGGDGGGTTGVADSMSRMLADGGGDGGDGSNGSSSRTPAALVTLRTGDRVRWHVASIGDVDGLHNFHWHGHTVEINGHHVDQFTSIPGVTTSANLRPEEPGVWMLHCHVNEHADGGMMALYAVEGSPPPPLPPGGVERVYYIAAEEVEWDFLPLGVDKCSSPPVPITATHPGVKYVEGPFPTAATISRMTHGSISMRDSNMTDRIRGVSSGDGGGTAGNSSGNGGNNGGVGPRLGHRLLKTVFVEYGDASFTFVKPRASEDAYLGLLGPILRAEVGDTMKVVFRNRARVSVTVHPHGLRYTKANEGSPYADGSTLQDKLDDRVAPGQAYNYTWLVPERSGPGPRDASSVMWLYHGHFKETADTNAGMVGAIIITAKGMARSADDPRPRDVERELVVLMAVFDEGASANFKANLQRVDPWVIYNASAIETLRRDSEFKRSLQKHSINGYMYCNMPSPPPFIMSTTTSSLATATATATAATSHADATSNDDAGDPRLDQVLPSVVRFYAAALGSTMDAHTAYLGGFPLRLRNGQQQQPDATDSVMISAGSMVTSDVMFTSPGDFELECRVADHIAAGMRAKFSVAKPLRAPEPPLTPPPNVTMGAAAQEMSMNATAAFPRAAGSSGGGAAARASTGNIAMTSDPSPSSSIVIEASIPSQNTNPADAARHGAAAKPSNATTTNNAAAAAIVAAGGPDSAQQLARGGEDGDVRDEGGDVNGGDGGGGGVISGSSSVRTYFIQVEPVDWDYAPRGYVRCTDTDLSSQSVMFLNRTNSSIGSKYRKASYIGYTDASFATRLPTPPLQGLLGPLILTEAGDTLVIHFRNGLTDLPHHAVNLGIGGGLMVDIGTDPSCRSGRGLLPDKVGCVYRWRVPENAAPSPGGDFSTAAYGYTSTVDVVSAPSLGLMGVLLVARRGGLRERMVVEQAAQPAAAGGGNTTAVCGQSPFPPQPPSPAPPSASTSSQTSSPPTVLLPEGVDMLVVLSWQVLDENLSPYLEYNTKLAGINNKNFSSSAVEPTSSAYNPDEENRRGSARGAMADSLGASQPPIPMIMAQDGAYDGGNGVLGTNSYNESSSNSTGTRFGSSETQSGKPESVRSNADAGSAGSGFASESGSDLSDKGDAGFSYSDSSDLEMEMDDEDMEGESSARDTFKASNQKASINGYMYCNLPPPVLRPGMAVRWVLLSYGGESGLFHAPYFENQEMMVDFNGFSTQATLMPSVVRLADMTVGPPGTWLMYSNVHHDYVSGMVAQFKVVVPEGPPLPGDAETFLMPKAIPQTSITALTLHNNDTEGGGIVASPGQRKGASH